MKSIVLGLTMVLGLAGVAQGELLAGQVMLNSKDGRVLGLSTPRGLAAVAYGEKMQITGVPAIADLQLCDDVEVDVACGLQGSWPGGGA